jgi:hypothetical protein
MADVMLAQAAAAGPGAPIDARDACRRATLDAVGRAAFGYDFGALRWAAAAAAGGAGGGAPADGAPAAPDSGIHRVACLPAPQRSEEAAARRSHPPQPPPHASPPRPPPLPAQAGRPPASTSSRCLTVKLVLYPRDPTPPLDPPHPAPTLPPGAAPPDEDIVALFDAVLYPAGLLLFQLPIPRPLVPGIRGYDAGVAKLREVARRMTEVGALGAGEAGLPRAAVARLLDRRPAPLV